MTVVVNDCFGGFRIPNEICDKLGVDTFDDIKRDNPTLVNFVMSHGGRYGKPGDCTQLVAKALPDETTDWQVFEYDGLETLIYVVDGKIHTA